MEHAQVPVDVSPEEQARQRKWEAKQLDHGRPLGALELYRALNDAMDEAYEIFDLSNREVRFALILAGGLNASLAICAAQVGFGAGLSSAERMIEGAAIALYALIAVWFLLQAIETLRPGQFRPHLKPWPGDRSDFPTGVRYFEDVIERDTHDHWLAWRDVTLGQLNAELAVQVHSMCLKNHKRKLALRRLYTSLRWLTWLFAGIILLFLVFSAV